MEKSQDDSPGVGRRGLLKGFEYLGTSAQPRKRMVVRRSPCCLVLDANWVRSRCNKAGPITALTLLQFKGICIQPWAFYAYEAGSLF